MNKFTQKTILRSETKLCDFCWFKFARIFILRNMEKELMTILIKKTAC